MDNKKDDKYFLNKIIDDISFVLANTKNMTFEEFDNDEIINSAVNFKFIQISENVSTVRFQFFLLKFGTLFHPLKSVGGRSFFSTTFFNTSLPFE